MRNVMNKNKKWWKKDGRKTCKKETQKNREIHFKNTEEFFKREREIQSDETDKTGTQASFFLEWWESFSMLLRLVIKFQSVGTAPMRKFDLYFIQRWTFVFSDVCLTQRSSCVSHVVELVPRCLGASVKSLKSPAAQRPAIHNPTVVHLSLSHCTFVATLLRLVVRFVPQPFCAQTSTYLPNVQTDSD